MRVYLDNCVLNRPFDDQSGTRVRTETEAIAVILEYVRSHSIDLVWSSVLDYENERSPISERREAVSQWRSFSIIEIAATENVERHAGKLLDLGIRALDALHIASAAAGSADYFVTTDDKIIKRKEKVTGIAIVTPIELLEILQR